MPVPGPVTNLIATPRLNSVYLTWTLANNGGLAIRDFQVQYLPTGGTWTNFQDGVTANRFATVGGLNPNQTYLFRVRANNAAGWNTFVSTTAVVSPLPAIPTSPTLLTATSISGSKSISLSWKASTSVTPVEYVVQYSTNSDWTVTAPIVQLPTNIKQATLCVIPNLNNGTTYYCRVIARNRGGFSPAWSNTASALVRSVAQPPSSLVGNFGDKSVALSWIAPSDNGGAPVTSYSVGYSSDGGKTWTTVTTPNNTTSFTVTNLTNGVNYIFRVASNNAAGVGLYGFNTSSIMPRKAPSEPLNLVGNPLNGSVYLTWTAPADNGGVALFDYEIQYSDGIGPQRTWKIFEDGVSTATNATVTGLMNGASYTFRVSAKNIVGVGTRAITTGQVIPRTVPSAPTAVSGLSQPSSVDLWWTLLGSDNTNGNGGSPILSYSIQYSSDNGATWTSAPNSTSSEKLSSISNLTNGTSYIFRVAAVNAAGTGPYSVPSGPVIPLAKVPGVPLNVIAYASDKSVSLSWTAPATSGGSPILDYVVQLSTNNGFTWTNASDAVSSALTTTVPSLTNGTSYVFRIAAVNSIGTGPYSVKTASVIPLYPEILFDMDDSSWTQVPAPYYTYMRQAMINLSKYIKYDPSIVAGIRSNPGYANWKGITISSLNLTRTGTSGTIASCGPYYGYRVDTARVAIMTCQVNINLDMAAVFSPAEWVKIFMHELCHALGIGTVWTKSTNSSGVSLNLIDGSIYPNTQAAYNKLSGLSRTFTPIESRGNPSQPISTQGASIDSHWEDNRRPSTGAAQYYGFLNELMVYSIQSGGPVRLLSELTIKNLVDLGYQEINPGAVEGIPTLVTTVRTVSEENPGNLPNYARFTCGTKPEMRPLP